MVNMYGADAEAKRRDKQNGLSSIPRRLGSDRAGHFNYSPEVGRLMVFKSASIVPKLPPDTHSVLYWHETCVNMRGTIHTRSDKWKC